MKYLIFLSVFFLLLFDYLFFNEFIKIIVDKIMESNGILLVLWIINFEKVFFRFFKLIFMEVKKILFFINLLWFCVLVFFLFLIFCFFILFY